VLVGTVGAAVGGYTGIAVTEYKGSPLAEAALLAFGWGLPYGLVCGALCGGVLNGIRYWRWRRTARSESHSVG